MLMYLFCCFVFVVVVVVLLFLLSVLNSGCAVWYCALCHICLDNNNYPYRKLKVTTQNI